MIWLYLVLALHIISIVPCWYTLASDFTCNGPWADWENFREDVMLIDLVFSFFIAILPVANVFIVGIIWFSEWSVKHRPCYPLRRKR